MNRDATADRLLLCTQELARKYPHGYADLLAWREDRELPSWLFVPLDAGIYAVRSEDLRQGRVETPSRRPYILADAAALAVLGTWRISRGVYEFAPELLSALWATPLKGEIPAEVLRQLPEFAPYLVLPEGTTFLGQPLAGVWAALDQRPDGAVWLRLLLDLELPASLPPMNISLPLGSTVDAALEQMAGKALENWEQGADFGGLEQRASVAAAKGVSLDERQLWQGVLSLLLYLCSKGPDYPSAARPQRATPQEVRRARHTTGKEVRRWVLGHRTAQAMRQSREQAPAPASGHREMPTHWRNPRWTVVWTGKGKQTPEVRWEPGLLVRADRLQEGAEQRIVVRKVQDGS